MLKKTACSPQSAFYLHSDRWRSPPPPFIPELSVVGGECSRNQSFYANSLAARDETKPIWFLMSFYFSLVVFAFLTLSETWSRMFDCVTRLCTVQTQVPAGWFISRRATSSPCRLFYLYSCGSGKGVLAQNCTLHCGRVYCGTRLSVHFVILWLRRDLCACNGSLHWCELTAVSLIDSFVNYFLFVMLFHILPSALL